MAIIDMDYALGGGRTWQKVGSGTNSVTGLSLGDYEEVFIKVGSPSWGQNFTRVIPTIILSNDAISIGCDGVYGQYGECHTYVYLSLTTITTQGVVNNSVQSNLIVEVYAR